MTHERRLGKAYKSPSTGQNCDAAQYIAELMCLRRSEFQNSGNLGYKFWNKSHKESYKGQIVAAKRLIQQFDEKLLISFINSPQGKKIYSLGFFKPLDFVVEAIKKYKVIYDKQEKKRLESIKKEEPEIVPQSTIPAKPFAKKKTLLSKITSLEKKNGKEDADPKD